MSALSWADIKAKRFQIQSVADSNLELAFVCSDNTIRLNSIELPDCIGAVRSIPFGCLVNAVQSKLFGRSSVEVVQWKLFGRSCSVEAVQWKLFS